MTKILPSKIRLQRLSLLFASIGCLAANPIPSPAVDFYVATNGNDAWLGHLTAPKGNTVERNVSMGGKWLEIEKAAEPLVKFTDNLVGQEPRFVDAAHLNFQLRKDSPAWKLGFKPIPVQSIGVYKSDERASWPVANQLREK